MNAKLYVFRPTGQDEGVVAQLTDEQAEEIQRRIDTITEIDDENAEPPYYLYEMDSGTFEDIKQILDEETDV